MTGNEKSQLDKAIELHKKGDVAGAIRSYRKFIDRNPRHAGALNLLGLAYFQYGNAEKAAPALKDALALQPELPGANYNLGTVLQALGRHEEAAAHLEKALAQNTNDADARNNLASSLRALGQNETAIAHLEQIVAKRPDYLPALLNLAKSFAMGGQFDKAATLYSNAVSRNPQIVEAYLGLGAALRGLGRFDEAAGAYQRAASLTPRNADVQANFAKALQQAGRLDEAAATFKAAIALKPEMSAALNDLGSVLIELKRPAEALPHIEEALRLEPELAVAHANRAGIHHEMNQFEDALASFERALSLGLSGETDVNARLVMGNTLQALGRYNDAARICDQIIAEHPRDKHGSTARSDKSLMLLNLGKFAEGWPLFEFRAAPEPRNRNLPRWNGNTMEGTLLVWGEQGLGDYILYASMMADLRGRAGSIVLEVEPRLVTLFARSFAGIRVVPVGADLSSEKIDAQISLLSLGQFLRPTWESFPERKHGYLIADPARAASLRNRLTANGDKLIGISWRSTNAITGRNKSAQLHDFVSLMRKPGIRLVDLQYGDTAEERATLERELGLKVICLDDIDNMNDIDGLASLISACDAIVTISNTTAHLAGALGRRTWVFVPSGYAKIWYWFKSKSRSPWYPDVQVIHQDKGQPWKQLIEAASGEILSSLGMS